MQRKKLKTIGKKNQEPPQNTPTTKHNPGLYFGGCLYDLFFL